MRIALPWAIVVLALFFVSLAIGSAFQVRRLERMVFDAEARLRSEMSGERKKNAQRRWRILKTFSKELGLIKRSELPLWTRLHDCLCRWTPPPQIPKNLQEAYTIKGRIPVVYWYHDDAYSEEEALIFETAEVERLREKARRREEYGYAGTDHFLYSALNDFPVYGLLVAVMGSVRPWYEAVALEFGARSCLTIEYNRIISSHPLIRATTPDDFEGHHKVVDAVFSISSFEHDGLGRYGDQLSPDADLEAMRKTRAMLRPGGYLYLSVPIGRDLLVWNAHRIYGNLRFPLLVAGWERVAQYGCKREDFERDRGKGGGFQPVFVLRKTVNA